ncbi:MAG: ATP-binding protein [Magnetococcus sp. DMHC-1]|nr:AAA family ATPase [Magnetococcales bacterium]
MLDKFTLKNFRSYKESTLHLAPLTMLIGANASGKSNTIEALRLLSWLAQGNRLHNIQKAIQDGSLLLRGRVRDIVSVTDSDVFFSCHGKTNEKNISLSLSMNIDKDDALHIVNEEMREKLGNGTSYLYKIIGRDEGFGTDVRVEYNNFARGGNKPRITCSDQLTIFFQLDGPAKFQKGHKESQERILGATSFFRSWLSNILFIDPVPSMMRGYSFRNEKMLLGDGRNLSSVLFHLWGGNKTETDLTDQEKENRADILKFIRSLPEQDIETISFIPTPRDEVMIKIRETFGGRVQEFDASMLSDGTLRVLAIAAAMLSIQERGMVVIEEIDNGIHPSRVEGLLKQIAFLSEKRNLRVLLSSHNPAMLDALPMSAIPDVVFCYRDPKDGYSRLIRMQDVPDNPELLCRGSMGYLMTSGIMDKFVKYHPGPEAKKKMALEWLEELNKDLADMHASMGNEMS